MQQKIPHKDSTTSATANGEMGERKNLTPSADPEAEAIPHLDSKEALQSTSTENPKPDQIARHLKQLLERCQNLQIQLGRDFHEVSQNLSGAAFLADVIARDLRKKTGPLRPSRNGNRRANSKRHR